VKAIYYSIFGVLYLVASSALAVNDECKSLSKKLTEQRQNSVVCQCGARLANLEVTLPSGIKIEAACGLTTNNFEDIDLKKRKVSLDNYSASGGYVFGDFYLTGKFRLKGEIVIDPDAEDMYFYPETEIRFERESVFESNFRSFSLGGIDTYKKFRAPKPSDLMPCLYAKAEIVVNSFFINVSDTHNSGTYPRNIEVLSVSTFKKCPSNKK
jgi:hypothetical protein